MDYSVPLACTHCTAAELMAWQYAIYGSPYIEKEKKGKRKEKKSLVFGLNPNPGRPIMDKTPQNVSLVVPPEIRVSGRPVRPRYIMYLPAASVGYVSRAVKHMESIRNP